MKIYYELKDRLIWTVLYNLYHHQVTGQHIVVDRAAPFQSKKVREDAVIAVVPVLEPVPMEPASAPVLEAVDKRLLGGQFEMGKKIGSGAFVCVRG